MSELEREIASWEQRCNEAEGVVAAHKETVRETLENFLKNPYSEFQSRLEVDIKNFLTAVGDLDDIRRE